MAIGETRGDEWPRKETVMTREAGGRSRGECVKVGKTVNHPESCDAQESAEGRNMFVGLDKDILMK